jgi:hypothetical protein
MYKNILTLSLLLLSTITSAQDATLIERLQQGGLNIFIRHGITPGIDHKKYNPPSERPNDCSPSSRQLNDEGKEQSKRIGQRIKDLNIPIGEVYSSKFCRCEETAKLAFGRFTSVDWLVVRPGVLQSQLDKELKSIPSTGVFTKTPTGKNNVFVGHAVTFTSGVLSSDFPAVGLAEGEAVIIEPGSPLRVLGKIKFY